MKICLIDFNLFVRGGVEQVTVSLANALCKKYEVHVLSLCSGERLDYSLDSSVRFSTMLSETS